MEINFLSREGAGASSVTVAPGGVRVTTQGGATTVDAAGVTVRAAEGAVPSACESICSSWSSLSELQQGCVTLALDARDYDVIGNLGCIDVQSTSACFVCWGALGVTADDCTAVAQACLGR